MATPQPGIFAQGTRSHHHLELDATDPPAAAELVAALAACRESVAGGGVKVVFGLSTALWAAVAPPDEVPLGGGAFTAVEGVDATAAPSTQHDLWAWCHGAGPDETFDVARAIAATLAPVAEVAVDQPCFVYRDSRDLTGFVDGTANPSVDEAPAVACLAAGEPGAGGSFVLTQRWVHDLDAFGALAVAEQERVIGRTKSDSLELEGDAKPPTAHIARVEIEGDDGGELAIYRRSTPYGTLREHGLYFVAFSADASRFDAMLARMFGTAGDGLRDRLLDYTRPVSGSLYFAPSIDALDALGP